LWYLYDMKCTLFSVQVYHKVTAKVKIKGYVVIEFEHESPKK
jgi:hypothetical protein